MAAIDGLVRDVGHGSSPMGSSPRDSERSSDSWEVLEDYEICEAQGGMGWDETAFFMGKLGAVFGK